MEAQLDVGLPTNSYRNRKVRTIYGHQKKMTGMLIHGFDVAHAATAALLAQTVVGDEAALTALTVAMIVAVAKLNGADWDSGAALAFLGVFIGGYVGVRGAALGVSFYVDVIL